MLIVKLGLERNKFNKSLFLLETKVDVNKIKSIIENFSFEFLWENLVVSTLIGKMTLI